MNVGEPDGGDSTAPDPDGTRTEREPDPEPEAVRSAEAVFGDGMPLARRYADLLTGSGTQRGLIGPREGPRLWSRHLLNCVAAAPLVPRGASVIDVGSGAGLPGLVLAIARPDLRMTLLEPLLRRTTWLDEVVTELDLDVRVLRARAQDCALRADVVTARAVAPLDRLLPLCLPLVRPGGQVLALKGDGAAAELAGAEEELRRGGISAEVVVTGSGAQTSTVVRARVPAGRPGSRAAGRGEPVHGDACPG